MKPQAIEAMEWDVEAAKNYLLKKNNEGKLNIEQPRALDNCDLS